MPEINEISEILNLDSEGIKGLLSMGNILSMSGLIRITMKAAGCISSDDLIKVFKFAQPNLGTKFIRFKVKEFKNICQKSDSFLTYDNENRFCFPDSIAFK